jgi:mono/diheme cytochrome c family protein
VAGAFAIVGAGIIWLTVLGYRDSPVRADPSVWGPLPVAGEQFVRDDRCQSCHAPGGAGSPLEGLRLSKEPEWLLAHARDPEIIAPGLREPPRGGMSEGQARSILSFMRKVREGAPPPTVSPAERTASLAIGRYCANCHMIDGEGGAGGPDLSRIGATRDAAWLEAWIREPEAVDPFANMPAFGDALTAEEMTALAGYLAARR